MPRQLCPNHKPVTHPRAPVGDAIGELLQVAHRLRIPLVVLSVVDGRLVVHRHTCDEIPPDVVTMLESTAVLDDHRWRIVRDGFVLES